MTDLDDLAGPTPRAIPRFTGTEPINLPSYTFLLGDRMNCFMFARQLLAQSAFVYEEDFLGPIYDGVQAIYELPHLMTHYEIAVKYPKEVQAIRGALDIDLVSRLMKRTEDLLAFHPYQIVVRDTIGFSLPRIKDSIAISLEGPAIFTNMGQDKLVLPPDADLLKELRNLLNK